MLLKNRRATRVQRVYEELFDDFAKWTPSAAFKAVFQQSVIAEINRRLQSQDSLRIVEAGCGHGTWAQEIYESVSDADTRIAYQGIDFVASRIALARERMVTHPRATFAVANADVWQPPERVDLVISVEVVSHVSPAHCREWMRTWREWLLPGGTIIIIDKDKDTQHARKLHMERLKRRFLPRLLRGRPYYFPEHFDTYVQTLKYPSFRRISEDAAQLDYHGRPLICEGAFRGFVADLAPPVGDVSSRNP
jgi:ubiquinone/menaquinone biosynthesis C-methylase UbiE